MDQKTCYYCGTKYPIEDECCPLCGQTEIEPEALDETPVEITTEPEVDDFVEECQQRRNKSANLVSTIICIVLAVAVVAGALFILNTLGVLDFQKPSADETSLTLPVEEEPVPAEILCTGINLKPSTASFNTVGKTVRLTVTVEPLNCTQSVSYSSSDETVATVSDDGVVTCIGNGTAEITVSCGDFAKSMEVVCQLKEDESQTETAENTEATDETEATNETETTEESSEELSLSTDDVSLFSAGETTKIKVVGAAEGAAIEWATSNAAVATVEGGKVTAVSSGTATVSATVNGKTLKCTVRCKLPENAATEEVSNVVSNTSRDIFLTTDGIVEKTDITFNDQNGKTARLFLNGEGFTSADVAWTSTDTSVCIVDDVGNVTAVGSGTAEIIAEYQGVDYNCIVRCK